ncbi:SIR2 family protein [Leifsonia sp. LS-T14]|uniref:SIR2 family protein n=1 Tax=unclassified Leifsonia TaxID=2663824 RepID=UPI0035A64313
MQLSDVASALRVEPCVLFLGSGISIPSPSSQPSAAWILQVFIRRLARGLVPDGVLSELLDRWPLPEFVYGVCERYFGSGVYDVWSALELWRSHSSLGPNAGQLTAVHVAAGCGKPILTPNFDNFLEEAAAVLGLKVVRDVAWPGHGFSPAPAQQGVVNLWKLHGTAEEIGSVFSSVRTLTTPQVGVREAIRRALSDDARLVLAGYSGRDLDLFPHVAGVTTAKSPIWVDLNFPPEHRSQLLSTAPQRATGSFDTIGRLYARQVGGTLERLVEEATKRDTSADSTAVHSEAEAHIQRVADRCSDSTKRRLVLAELLINSGMSNHAIRVLEGPPVEGLLETERTRLSAKALWEKGRFVDSHRLAASRLGQAAGPERALLQFSMAVAAVRQRVPPGGLPLPLNKVSVFVRAAAASALLLLNRGSYCRRYSIPEPIRTPFTEGYLEHAIRVALAFQLALSSTSGGHPAAVRLVLGKIWLRISLACVRTGYAEGAGNCSRYLSRLGLNVPDALQEIHDFLGHSLGVAIAFRDASNRQHAAGNEAEARRLFRRGLQIAGSQEDPTLILTFLGLGDRLGEVVPIDRSALSAIQAKWTRSLLHYIDERERTSRGIS